MGNWDCIEQGDENHALIYEVGYGYEVQALSNRTRQKQFYVY